MYFEGRHLKQIAQPVSKTELKVNDVYFTFKYLGDDIPSFEPVVFIGFDLDPEHPGEAYFQDFASHREGVTFSSSNSDDSAYFFVVRDNQIGFIFDFERGLDELLKCSLRRQDKRDKSF